MRGAGARVHDPCAALLAVVWQAGRFVVAPGTAIVTCNLAPKRSAPAKVMKADPYSGFTREPSFSAASNAAARAALSAIASNFLF